MLNTDLMKKGEVIAVALSGGKDSVCLLDMLLTERERVGITVKAVNIDHGIRGETSVRDSEFVKALCDKLGVPLFFKKIDCVLFSEENGFSPEEGARILRYKVFDEVIKSGFCDKIATAHHASDRARERDRDNFSCGNRAFQYIKGCVASRRERNLGRNARRKNNPPDVKSFKA